MHLHPGGRRERLISCGQTCAPRRDGGACAPSKCHCPAPCGEPWGPCPRGQSWVPAAGAAGAAGAGIDRPGGGHLRKQAAPVILEASGILRVCMPAGLGRLGRKRALCWGWRESEMGCNHTRVNGRVRLQCCGVTLVVNLCQACYYRKNSVIPRRICSCMHRR
jgi:hypothetical protein